mmetsp:Transcript_54768/g.132971  ORF Transcript_54768/g.132971 Transcript_54768/m.132971 type:complete len:194 (+) Transcript_54768:92-673(+)
MYSLASSVLVVAAIAATAATVEGFTPSWSLASASSATGRSSSTVVQDTIRSQWTMMPDEPTPEVDPRRKNPDEAPPTSPVRMPVIDTDGGQMDVLSRLLKDRILLLGQGVDDEVANVLVAQLLYLANEDPEKDITLYINSPGGSVSAGMAIYDTSKCFKNISILVLFAVSLLFYTLHSRRQLFLKYRSAIRPL